MLVFVGFVLLFNFTVPHFFLKIGRIKHLTVRAAILVSDVPKGVVANLANRTGKWGNVNSLQVYECL